MRRFRTAPPLSFTRPPPWMFAQFVMVGVVSGVSTKTGRYVSIQDMSMGMLLSYRNRAKEKSR